MDKRIDSGALMAVKVKKSEKSPDYFGEIVIDLANLTKIEQDGKVYTVKLSGWKRRSKNGDVFLSLAVDRWVPKTAPKAKDDDLDEDVPF